MIQTLRNAGSKYLFVNVHLKILAKVYIESKPNLFICIIYVTNIVSHIH